MAPSGGLHAGGFSDMQAYRSFAEATDASARSVCGVRCPAARVGAWYQFHSYLSLMDAR